MSIVLSPVAFASGINTSVAARGAPNPIAPYVGVSQCRTTPAPVAPAASRTIARNATIERLGFDTTGEVVVGAVGRSVRPTSGVIARDRGSIDFLLLTSETSQSVSSDGSAPKSLASRSRNAAYASSAPARSP